MTASEVAFLALGLVLGVASGAALIEVLRAHPPAAREVRVTVARNAIHSRLAATLADPQTAVDAFGPARGGPGDRRWRDETAASGEPAATGRRVDGGGNARRTALPDSGSGTAVRSTSFAADGGAPSRNHSMTALGERPLPGARPARLWLSPAASSGDDPLVAVPMLLEPDPITIALRASAAASAVAAMRSGAAASASTATAAAPDAGAGDAAAAEAPPTSTARADSAREPVAIAPIASDEAAPTAAGGPCAEERRVADERCAVAVRARDGAAVAAGNLRRSQRAYDDHVARAEAGAAKVDPRAVRSAKERAQQRFREARSGARTRDDVEAGAREWLAEINRINLETRDAAAAIERDRAAGLALGPTVDRLAVEADAARISAERAEEACTAARESVADCDEARALDEAALRSGGREPAVDEQPAEIGEETGEETGEGRIALVTPEPEDEFGVSIPMNSRAGQDALILRILRGDREALQRVVARLGGDDADARRRWQTQLGGLAEALIARSIEASAFDFPIDHPFWGPFSQSQNRDIAAGLSSLGFRFDGFGDWVDERLPSQRDLSLAVGYAGLDPMRVRRWPNEAEMRDLLRDVRVAADEYVAGAAGGLTLGELVTLLGRRADGLTELWNQWGAVRPILLEAS